MRNMIETFLGKLGWPTRTERDELVRQLSISQAFAQQVAYDIADKAIIVGSDDVVLQHLALGGRTVLILPGVRRTLISGCSWTAAETPNKLISVTNKLVELNHA